MYTLLEERREQDSQLSEDYDELFSKESQDFGPLSPGRSRNLDHILFQIFLTLLISIFAFALGTWLGSYKLSKPSGRAYLEHVQQYCKFFQASFLENLRLMFKAPILKDVDTSMKYVTFNGSLMKENVFRQEAGPEVDAAWESIGVNCKFNFD